MNGCDPALGPFPGEPFAEAYIAALQTVVIMR